MIRSRYLDNTKLMVLGRGIEPLLVDWKPTVLTDRRTEYSGSFYQELPNLHAWEIVSELQQSSHPCHMLRIYRRLRVDFWRTTIIHQTILQDNHYLEWVTGIEPALLRFAICYLTIQCTPTYLWHGMEESNHHSHFRRVLSYPLNECRKNLVRVEGLEPSIN